MEIKCVWEHNGNDTLLYAEDYVGAFTRGENLDIALEKMQNEIQSYLAWCGESKEAVNPVVVRRKRLSWRLRMQTAMLFLYRKKNH